MRKSGLRQPEGMTQTDYFTSPSGYGVPATPTTVAPQKSALWRTVVTGLGLVLSLPCALMTAFAAAITWSVCFIGCTEPNHTQGALLWLLFLGFLAVGPALAALLLKTRSAVVAVAVVPILLATLCLGAALVAALPS